MERGSRRCCLELTGRSDFENVLNRLLLPSGFIISPDDVRFPCGFGKPDEIRLDTPSSEYLGISQATRDDLKTWWLKEPRHEKARTPFWDIVSSCNRTKGVILIEAKAHFGEVDYSPRAFKEGESLENHESIHKAILEAAKELRKASHMRTWKISRNSHYQLSNRFAWAWRLASNGIPVVLIYLGFLNVRDMEAYRPFVSPESWGLCMGSYSKGIIPTEAWEHKIEVNGTPIWAFIRSLPDVQEVQ